MSSQAQQNDANPVNGRLSEDTCFNNEILEFRFLPKDESKITERMLDDYSNVVGDQTKASNAALTHAQKHLINGIRLSRDERGGFVCVICDTWLSDDIILCSDHLPAHQNIEELLQKSKYGPVVGLEQIIQYRQADGDQAIVQHECMLCDLIFDEISIFWHVLSFVHKENFFRSKYSAELLSKIQDRTRRQESIDEILDAYEISHPRRGRFRQAKFEEGMIASTFRVLNMRYIENRFHSEVGRMKAVYQNSSSLMNECQKGMVRIQIVNQHQLQQGKAILQKLNKAIIDFTSVKV